MSGSVTLMPSRIWHRDVLEPGYVPAAYAVECGLLPETLRGIFERIPAQQIAGIELAEFEASLDEAKDAAALKFMMDAVLPLLIASGIRAP